MHYDEVEELKEKLICSDCIGESYLASLVDAEGEDGECSYCGCDGATITVEDLAGRIEAAFEAHFSRTADEPDSYQSMMLRDKEISYDWYREGDETVIAIQEAAGLSDEASQDVQAILDWEHSDFEAATMGLETEFSEDAHYEEKMPSDEEWHVGWRSFVMTIKSEARFFSRSAAEQLGKLFDSIDEMATHSGGSIVVDGGPGTSFDHFYRARVFQSDEELEEAMKRPDQGLGAPPTSVAASGRMNARGIPVFYGATSEAVVLAEVRPPVGSQVLVGRFDIVRPIRLLDLSALSDIRETGSIFDPDYAYRLGRMMFLRSLSFKMARPVMPDDQEMEYLPTQAIADFLATEGKVPLDGILFPSVQVAGAGQNVVLFNKSSRCEKLDIPKGTKLGAHTYMNTEDGPEPDYTVFEEVLPPPKSEPKQEKKQPCFEPFPFPYEELESCDPREETLRADAGSLKVHHVSSIEINTETFSVTRHRWEQREPPF